jgi:hypothetical protein
MNWPNLPSKNIFHLLFDFILPPSPFCFLAIFPSFLHIFVESIFECAMGEIFPQKVGGRWKAPAAFNRAKSTGKTNFQNEKMP